MGYHASGSGRIAFTKNIEDVKKMKFGNELGAGIFEKLTTYWFEYESDFYDTDNSIYLWHPDDWNYHGDFIELLDKLSPVIRSGCLEFIGEDNCMWKIEFNPDSKEWAEYNGDVVYEDEKKILDDIAQAFNSYVNYDLAGADTDYIREVLTDVCGLDMKALKYCGLDWIFCKE